MEGLIKTKENGHYNDTVRATYQDFVMMGVGINNIKKVVRTVLTNFTNMDIECLPKATLARLMHTESRGLNKLQVAENLLTIMIVLAEPYIPMALQNLAKLWNI